MLNKHLHELPGRLKNPFPHRNLHLFERLEQVMALVMCEEVQPVAHRMCWSVRGEAKFDVHLYVPHVDKSKAFFEGYIR